MQADKVLSEISIKVGQLEVLQQANTKAISDMASSVDKLVTKLEESDDLAREALQSTRSAHHRIDDITKRVMRIEDDFKWLWRTVVGAVIAGGIALIFEIKNIIGG